jgi:hypothetical protein
MSEAARVEPLKEVQSRIMVDSLRSPLALGHATQTNLYRGVRPENLHLVRGTRPSPPILQFAPGRICLDVPL